MVNPSYKTRLGNAYLGDSLDLIDMLDDDSIDLAITSPPFALLRPKEYGNKAQADYVHWLGRFGKKLLPKLKEAGSLVIDLGGAYERGVPVRSLYNFRVLLYFCDVLGYHLAEEFFWNNPSKLPSPIEWVNKRKIRAKDSVNTVWWLSKGQNPKADVRNVLAPYSERMKKLIQDPEKFYTPKKRPSGHDIGQSFASDNGGAIPSNLLSFANSESNSSYLAACKALNIQAHPARFPKRLPEFFIKFLTSPGDHVLDFFSGSNTTGEVCEELERNWTAFEISAEYMAASALRFIDDSEQSRSIYRKLLDGEEVGMLPFSGQLRLGVV